MSIHELSLDAAGPGERRARDLAAALLRVLSRALGLLAERVAPAASAPVLDAVIEYLPAATTTERPVGQQEVADEKPWSPL